MEGRSFKFKARGKTFTVTLNEEATAERYSLHAMCNLWEVGVLVASIDNDINTATLENVEVKEGIPTRSSEIISWVRGVWAGFCTMSFRHHEIGSRMLAEFLDYCRKRGIEEVSGSVVQGDLDVTPRLLNWYRRFGFGIEQPDTGCMRDAVHKVVWRNDVAGLTEQGSR